MSRRWGGPAYQQAHPHNERAVGGLDAGSPETIRDMGFPLPHGRRADPRRVIVVHNTAVPWSLTTAQHWAKLRGVLAEYVGFDFGVNAINHTKSWTDQYATDPDTLWTDLLQPVGALAERLRAEACFMAPATPYLISMTAKYLDGTPGTEARPFMLPEIFGCARGLYLARTLYGVPMPSVHFHQLGFSGSYGLQFDDDYRNSPSGVWCTADFVSTKRNSVFLYRPATSQPEVPHNGVITTHWYGPDYHLPVTGSALRTDDGPGSIGTMHPGVIFNSPQGSIGGNEIGSVFCSYTMLVGRIGRPVIHDRGLSEKVFLGGDETEAEAVEIIEDAVESEGSYADHKDKPIWVGIHSLTQGVTNRKSCLIVDMFRKAGFENVNYFYRTIDEPDYVNYWCPAGEKAFDYADIAGATMHENCFMLFNGFRNAGIVDATQNAGQETDGVSGLDITNTFDYMKGALSFVFTSVSLLHPMRCQARTVDQHGGVGGVGARYESGGSTNPLAIAFGLLNGMSVVESTYFAGTYAAGGSSCIGDPLYAPFRYELPRRDMWMENLGPQLF